MFSFRTIIPPRARSLSGHEARDGYKNVDNTWVVLDLGDSVKLGMHCVRVATDQVLRAINSKLLEVAGDRNPNVWQVSQLIQEPSVNFARTHGLFTCIAASSLLLGSLK